MENLSLIISHYEAGAGREGRKLVHKVVEEYLFERITT